MFQKITGIVAILIWTVGVQAEEKIIKQLVGQIESVERLGYGTNQTLKMTYDGGCDSIETEFDLQLKQPFQKTFVNNRWEVRAEVNLILINVQRVKIGEPAPACAVKMTAEAKLTQLVLEKGAALGLPLNEKNHMIDVEFTPPPLHGWGLVFTKK